MRTFYIDISDFKIKFVNRNLEIEVLTRLSKYGSPFPIFIYGPEGCGKTTLFRYFVHTCSKNLVCVYINALEDVDISKAIESSTIPEIASIALRVINEIGEGIAKSLLKGISLLIKHLATCTTLSDRNLVLFIDDVVYTITLGKIEWYIKWLYELIPKLKNEYNLKSILIVTSTSEGLSRKLLLRHTYSEVYLIWNLEYEAFQELTKQLRLSSETSKEIWKLTGGNPRQLIDIVVHHRRNLKSWINKLRDKVIEIVTEIKAMNLINELKNLLRNIDLYYEEPNEKTKKLIEFLEEKNLIIYKNHQLLTGNYLKENDELGIGKYYAWQIPVYRMVIHELTT